MFTTIVLGVCLTGIGTGTETEEPAAAPPAASYSLHEWGVFPVPRSSAWAMADLLAEWKTFPDFFHGGLPERELVYRGPVTKPVIWLHGTEAMAITLEVEFATGRPLIWWPPAEIPATGAPWNEDRPGLLQWQLGLHQPHPPLGGGPGGGPEHANPAPPVPADHWVQSLRSVVSAPVFTNGSWGRLGRGPVYQDSFLYYDGVMKAPPSPTVRRTEDGLELQSQNDHLALDAFCIERRDGVLRVARDWFEVPEGAQRTAVEMIPVPGAEEATTVERLGRQLVQRCARQGLEIDESLALGEVWSEGFFEVEGLSFLYRVSQQTYDRWLPLQAQPAPTKTVRVGWVLHRHLQPELEDDVRALLRQLADPDAPEEQWRAHAARLAALGGAAFPWMKEALATEEQPLADRVREILDSLDATALLDLPD